MRAVGLFGVEVDPGQDRVPAQDHERDDDGREALSTGLLSRPPDVVPCSPRRRRNPMQIPSAVGAGPPGRCRDPRLRMHDHMEIFKEPALPGLVAHDPPLPRSCASIFRGSRGGHQRSHIDEQAVILGLGVLDVPSR